MIPANKVLPPARGLRYPLFTTRLLLPGSHGFAAVLIVLFAVVLLVLPNPVCIRAGNA